MRYESEIVPGLKDKFQYSNPMMIPRLAKIVLNMGLGEAIHNIKVIDSAINELRLISGQQPVVTKAKKSIAAFKLREGMPIGCMVTLRKKRMYDFCDKLIIRKWGKHLQKKYWEQQPERLFLKNRISF